MLFKNANRQVIYETPKAVGCLLASLPDAELVEMTLCRDGEVPPHSLDIPVTFYVVCGTGIISVDSDAFDVAVGDIVTSPPGSTRALATTGDGDFQLLVIKHTVA